MFRTQLNPRITAANEPNTESAPTVAFSAPVSAHRCLVMSSDASNDVRRPDRAHNAQYNSPLLLTTFSLASLAERGVGKKREAVARRLITHARLACANWRFWLGGAGVWGTVVRMAREVCMCDRRNHWQPYHSSWWDAGEHSRCGKHTTGGGANRPPRPPGNRLFDRPQSHRSMSD